MRNGISFVLLLAVVIVLGVLIYRYYNPICAGGHDEPTPDTTPVHADTAPKMAVEQIQAARNAVEHRDDMPTIDDATAQPMQIVITPPAEKPSVDDATAERLRSEITTLDEERLAKQNEIAQENAKHRELLRPLPQTPIFNRERPNATRDKQREEQRKRKDDLQLCGQKIRDLNIELKQIQHDLGTLKRQLGQ